MLDTIREIQTPEGIALRLRPAGPLPRMYAWLIDLLIRGVIFAVVAIPMGYLLGKASAGPLAIVAFIILWFYPVLFEVLHNGQTPGKQHYQLRTLHDDGTPIGWTSSLLRNLMRTVDFLPFLYGLGLVSMLLTRDFRRLGDITAGSLVVHSDSPEHTHHIPAATPMAPPVPLTAGEQQIIINYAERAERFHPARADELATLAAPILLRPTANKKDLLGIANWIAGSS